MGVTVVRPETIWETVRIDMYFESRDGRGSGWAFTLSPLGEVLSWATYRALVDEASDLKPWGHPVPLSAAGEENLRKCLDGTYRVFPAEVSVYHGTDRDPAEGLCPCGGLVVLSSDINPCERCGREFARQGWEMAPREQWGEEIAYGMEDEALEAERLESSLEVF